MIRKLSRQGPLSGKRGTICQGTPWVLRVQRDRMSSLRARRGNLAFDRWPTRKERLLRKLAQHGLSSRAQRNVPSGYGDLGCSGLADSQKRDCFAGSTARSVIASAARQSRLFRAGGQSKERLLRGLAMTKTPVIARNEAISPFRSRQTEKREIASQARNDKDSCDREERSDLAFDR